MPSKNISLMFQAANHLFSPTEQVSTIEALLNMLPKVILLREIWYFGIQCEDQDGVKFTKMKKKVSHYRTPGSNTVKLWLKVRFYPKDVIELIEDVTRFHFYYEARESIVEGKIHCPPETAVILASYQALIRFGPYQPEIYNSGNFRVSDFLPERILKSHNLTDEHWEQKIASLHRELGDIASEDAILEYLKIAQELHMYGVAYYPVVNKRGTHLFLGIDPFGLNVYEKDNKLIPSLGFAWSEIRTLTYSGTKLTIKPVDKSAADFVATCPSDAVRKEIVVTIIGYRNLQVRFERTAESIEVQQMKIMAKETQQARQAERKRLAAERLAREDAEKRLQEMEKALHERQAAFERSQATLSNYQRKVEELEEQLESERKARLDLEEMQRRLEAVNRMLERETLASAEERAQLIRQKEAVQLEIMQQREILEQQEAEKRKLEEMVRAAKEAQTVETNGSTNGRNVEFPEDVGATEVIPEAKLAGDVDYAQQVNLVKKELEAVRDPSKMEKVDIIYEESMKKGMDKYRTLRQIRQGNTKKRVELFECL